MIEPYKDELDLVSKTYSKVETFTVVLRLTVLKAAEDLPDSVVQFVLHVFTLLQ